MTQTFVAPVSFVSLDLDFYSSTSAALQVLLREAPMGGAEYESPRDLF
jgi:hypothetical protein